ncbi:urease accessory protein F [Biomphalaria pfeifferi]|uniref:Urease accessory protein F n=1 Tax=Biomphalaria pfeifferi TaxID=112525 RepID=A0AAD8BV51_BIOPF|nr:urease accessory protein F [Biomphalaria pfeifferi]
MDANQLLMLLQLTDSAFPTGGFVHSLGIESFVQYFGNKQVKKADDNRLNDALISVIENSASFNLPLIKSAYITVSSFVQLHRRPNSDNTIERSCKDKLISLRQTNIDKEFQQVDLIKTYDLTDELVHMDKLCEAMSTSHTVRRASSRQGKAFREVSLMLYPDMDLAILSALKDLPHCHYPVIYGAVLAGLSLDLDTTLTSFTFGINRSLITTLVKLDVVGTLEGQRTQLQLQETIPNIVERNKRKVLTDACVKFPLVDILQNLQDTFFTKMFYS